MVEAKYYKDFRHNYLILKQEDAVKNSYQCRMITENKITGLLNCQERHIDGELLLYYDITSKQSLQSLYEGGCITIEFMKKLLRQLQRTRESMTGYLLTESCLLLYPEFVFADVESGELFFLYFPFEPEKNGMLPLMEFLTDRVDAEDKEAVELNYKILQLLEKEQFVLDEILQWFEEDYAPAENQKNRKMYEQMEQRESWEEDEEEGFCPEPKEREPHDKQVLFGEKMVGGIMLALLLVSGFLFYLYRTYELTEQQWIYFYAASAGMVILFFICGGYLFVKRLFAKKDLSGFGNKGGMLRYEEERLYQAAEPYHDLQKKEEPEYGNTIFIPWVENCENKLYGSGKGNKNHIDLNRLPLTVGKLAGSVDMVIPDQSLSRRHVKFSREGNRICMTDLNSTNGTFKNGLRLEPNTSEILEPGDEIRLGKLKFIYR